MVRNDAFPTEAEGTEARDHQVQAPTRSDGDTAKGAAPGGTSSTVPWHALEDLFVDHNIRFAAGMLFAAPVAVKSAREALAAGLQVSGLDRLRVLKSDESCGTANAIALANESSFVGHEHVPMGNASLASAVEALVARRDVPALGRVQCYVLLASTDSSVNDNATASSGSDAVGIVINANHALCDGRLLRACMEAIADAIRGGTPPQLPNPGPAVLRNLKEELTMWSTQNPPPVPKYLPPSQESVKVIRLNEIPCFVEPPTDDSDDDDATGAFTLRRDIPGAVATTCLQQLRPKQATVTGLMAASWIQAIDEVVKANAGTHVGGEEEKAVVTISCLVALHDQLPEGLYTNAFGTVTLAGDSASQAADGTLFSRQEFARQMLELAADCTKDLRRRIHRGEAAYQGLALCHGEFESSGATPGTVELSNLGVYRTSEAIQEVALQQQFDGHDGVSVLMATESHTNVLRLLANVGPMYSRRAMEGLMDRVVEIWSLVAECS